MYAMIVNWKKKHEKNIEMMESIQLPHQNPEALETIPAHSNIKTGDVVNKGNKQEQPTSTNNPSMAPTPSTNTTMERNNETVIVLKN